MIDDGSTDESPLICEEYSIIDNRFHVYHKTNGGLSDARNYGLRLATGEYVIFFDPDDWVDDKCLAELYKNALATQADMVICDYIAEDKYRSRYVVQCPTAMNHFDVLENILSGKLFGYTWNKLIKLSCYHNNHIEYPVGIYGCEDQFTMCELLMHDIKVVYLNAAFYHYVYYEGSLSRYYDNKTYKNDLRIRNMFVDLLNDTPYKEKAYNCKTSYMVHRAFLYGSKEFSSKRFKTLFSTDKELVLPYFSGYMKILLKLSFNGYYKLARGFFCVGYDVKQMIKSFRKFL